MSSEDEISEFDAVDYWLFERMVPGPWAVLTAAERTQLSELARQRLSQGNCAPWAIGVAGSLVSCFARGVLLEKAKALSAALHCASLRCTWHPLAMPTRSANRRWWP